MNREVVVHEAAEQEIAEAVTWYEARRPGLGADLIREAASALQSIAEGFDGIPYLGDHAIRRVLLGRFPYSVVFLASGTLVEVFAFAHHRRRPGYWRYR